MPRSRFDVTLTVIKWIRSVGIAFVAAVVVAAILFLLFVPRSTPLYLYPAIVAGGGFVAATMWFTVGVQIRALERQIQREAQED